jgi:FixJ family two-component response regulator
MESDKNISKAEAGHSAGNPAHSCKKTILLVDDGRDTRLMTKWFLDCVGFVVHAFSDAEDALSQFDPKIHDLVVTDNSMTPITGAEMAHIIKMRSPCTPVLMYTGAAPKDQSCLDLVVQRSTSLPGLKDAIDKLLAARR